MSRTCTQGHVVPEDDLRVCPRCGGGLAAPTGPRVRSLAPDQARPERVEVARTVPFLLFAVVLLAFGTLLTYAAERGPAEVFGWLLLAGAVVLVVLAVVDLVRRRRRPQGALQSGHERLHR